MSMVEAEELVSLVLARRRGLQPYVYQIASGEWCVRLKPDFWLWEEQDWYRYLQAKEDRAKRRSEPLRAAVL